MSNGTSKWEVSPEFPEGHLVPLTPEELAQRAADQTTGAEAAAALAARIVNAEQMRASLTSRMQEALDLAALIDANTATPAQQRQAVALLLRGTVRLTRLVFSLLDEAA